MKDCLQRRNVKKDKGYVWIVLAVSVVSHGLHMGFGLSVVGNMTIAHQKLFNIGVEQSGLISTAHLATIFLFGPIASIITKKFSCRVSAIFGGCCLIVGVGVSSFATQPWQAFVLFGIVAGAGIASLLVSSTEVLSQYFDKYRNLAFSLVVVGQNVGIAAFASLSQLLLDTYGYAIAMRILAAIHIFHIIFGLLLVKLEPEAPEGSKAGSLSDSQDAKDVQEEVSIDEIGDKDKEQGAAIQDEPKLGGADKTGNKQTWRQILTVIFKSFEVWMLIINQLLWGINEATALAFINDFIVYKLDLSEEEAALGITILGIATICASFFVMTLSKLSFDRTILHGISTAIFGLSTIGIAFSINKAMFYSMCALFGLGHGVCIANLTAFLYSYTTADQFAVFLGLMLLIEGVAIIASTPLIGYIFEHVGPAYGMIFSGCCGVSATLFLLPIPARRIWNARKYVEETEHVTEAKDATSTQT